MHVRTRDESEFDPQWGGLRKPILQVWQQTETLRRHKSPWCTTFPPAFPLPLTSTRSCWQQSEIFAVVTHSGGHIQSVAVTPQPALRVPSAVPPRSMTEDLVEAIPARTVTHPQEPQWTATATHNYHPTRKTPDLGKSIHRPANQSGRLASGQSRCVGFAMQAKCLHLLSNKHLLPTHKTCFQTGFNSTSDVKWFALEHCWHRHFDTDDTQDKPLHCPFSGQGLLREFPLPQGYSSTFIRSDADREQVPHQVSQTPLPHSCHNPTLLSKGQASPRTQGAAEGCGTSQLGELSSALPRVSYPLRYTLHNNPDCLYSLRNLVGLEAIQTKSLQQWLTTFKKKKIQAIYLS